MVNTSVVFNPKWAGIILFQIGIGLLCIFVPWYLAVMFSILLALSVFLHLRLQWWAYMFVFLIPFMGIKYPAVYLTVQNFVRGDAIPLLPFLSTFAFLSFIIHTLVNARKKTFKNPFFIPVLLLLCYSIFTLFWSPANIEFNMFYLMYLIVDVSLFYFLFYIIITNNESFHRRLMWCFLFSGVALALQSLWILFLMVTDSPGIITLTTVRISDWLSLDLTARPPEKGVTSVHGFFLGPQETSMVLDTTIYAGMGLLLTEKGKLTRWFIRIIIVMLMVVVFLTGTKSGIWSLIMISFIFVFLSSQFRKNFFRNCFIVLATFLTIIFSIIIISGPKKRDPRIINVSAQDQSSMGQRIGYWETGFKEINRRKVALFGLGIAGFKYVTIPQMISHAHNIYLSLFFDFGVIGLIFVFLIIFILLKMFLKILKRQNTYYQNMSVAFAINLLTIGVIGLVYIPYYMGYVWFILALGSSTFYMANKELSAQKKPDNG